jgi:hypothetical protein
LAFPVAAERPFSKRKGRISQQAATFKFLILLIIAVNPPPLDPVPITPMLTTSLAPLKGFKFPKPKRGSYYC